MPGRRAREAMPGRSVMLESTSGTCALELETGTNHFLVAARVEFGTGNRHVPFFRSCPRGVPRGVPRFRKYVSRAGGAARGFSSRVVRRSATGVLRWRSPENLQLLTV